MRNLAWFWRATCSSGILEGKTPNKLDMFLLVRSLVEVIEIEVSVFP